MRITYRKKTSTRVKNRVKKKVRIRKKIEGSPECPRLSVFRSLNHTYAQIIDDVNGKTLVATSTLKSGEKSKSNVAAAKEIGKKIAEAAKAQNIKKVVFDRNGLVFHGRVKAIAEGAREAGLEF